MPKRTRGAQPGNTNALKHGFYAQQFSQLELTDLETALGSGLGDEIALMRVLIRRFVEAVEAQPTLPLDDTSHFLNTLGSSMTRLAGLLRADKLLTGSDDSAVMQAIHSAIAEFTEDLKNA
jgi:hypothetical protein